MSSHHFVKEGQEPALLILDADSSEVVMSLLEWSPTVLVSAEVLSSVLLWGIKIDCIVTKQDDDIAQLHAISADQGPLKIISGDLSDTYLSCALLSLKRSGQRSVNIISTSPTEHFGELYDYLSSMDLAFVNDTLKWIPVAQKFEKWYPADTILNFHPFDMSQAIDVHNGVREGGIIRTTTPGLVVIYSDRPFWLGEPSS